MKREKQIDEFQSMFKRASRENYQYQSLELKHVTIITHQSQEVANSIQKELTSFLPQLGGQVEWNLITQNDFEDANQLLKCLHDHPSDLVVTHRHLHEDILLPQHSLGVYVDVLTQANKAPVLLLPGTASQRAALDKTCDTIMVATDHIAGDHRLVNHAALFAPENGIVWLCHVEDDAVYRRYLHVIERIPSLHTEETGEQVMEQLMNEAAAYIGSAVEDLSKRFPKTQWKSEITLGHQVQTYRRLADEHQADLVVLNTKDQGQLAMHGLAYSISVEIIDRPLLLL